MSSIRAVRLPCHIKVGQEPFYHEESKRSLCDLRGRIAWYEKVNTPGIESGDVTSDSSSLVYTPGGAVSGGNSIQPLDPEITAFQADVPFGSLWKVDPERAGPTI